jgi:hypothetical protein
MDAPLNAPDKAETLLKGKQSSNSTCEVKSRNIRTTSLLTMSSRQHIRERLISALEILLNGDMVLNLEPDYGGSAEEGEEEEAPVGGEFGHEGDPAAVERPHDGGAGRLDALVETDVVGGAATGVGESTHVPVSKSVN